MYRDEGPIVTRTLCTSRTVHHPRKGSGRKRSESELQSPGKTGHGPSLQAPPGSDLGSSFRRNTRFPLADPPAPAQIGPGRTPSPTAATVGAADGVRTRPEVYTRPRSAGPGGWGACLPEIVFADTPPGPPADRGRTTETRGPDVFGPVSVNTRTRDQKHTRCRVEETRGAQGTPGSAPCRGNGPLTSTSSSGPPHCYGLGRTSQIKRRKVPPSPLGVPCFHVLSSFKSLTSHSVVSHL